MSWSKLRSQVESFFADSVKGRVKLHSTSYRKAVRYDAGRAWITVDGEEITNMASSYFGLGGQDDDHTLRFSQSRLGEGMHDYLRLPIDAILSSEDSVVRALGMLDRRVGKRRLSKLDVRDAPPLVKYLYLLRCEAEGIRVDPLLTSEKGAILAHLQERHVLSKQYRAAYEDGWEKQQAEAVKKLSEARKHNLRTLIPHVKRGDISEDDLRTDVAREVFVGFQDTSDPELLERTLLFVESRSKLLATAELTRGTIALTTDGQHWLRQLESWKAKSHNARKQFSSLARHLWAEFDVPLFMDQAWIRGNTHQQDWFRHLGAGKNIRTADHLPIPLTKKMAHHFVQAPQHYPIEGAFRWAQVHAFGGDPRLADALLETRLVREFQDDKFWQTVLKFFVANPMLDVVHVGPIIDFIWHQRFEPQVVFVERGVAERRGPIQPNFSMRGRTVNSLLSAVADWHRQLGREAETGDFQWEKSAFADFEFREASQSREDSKTWSIRELLSSQELAFEGRRMKHCVATYARSCYEGKSSIWSMEVNDEFGRQPAVTIEVENARKLICQIRGKQNRRPTEQERAIVQRWATREELQLAAYL